jgi:hypothetical protein
MFASSLIIDRTVGLLIPAIQIQVAHPPSVRETRRNLEFTYEFRTNSQGLRYHELPLAKGSREEFRAVVLGDSMTEGTGVEADQTFAEVLERSYSRPHRPVYFINCGLAGAGPLQYGRVLASVGLKYHPDLILVAMYANDLTDTPENADLSVTRSSSGQYRIINPHFLYAPYGSVRKVASVLWPWAYARLQSAVATHEKNHFEHDLGLIDRVKEKARRMGIPDERVRDWQATLTPELVAACDRDEFNASVAAMGCLHPDHMIDNLDINRPEAQRQWTSMRHLLDQIVDIGRMSGVRVAIVYAPAPFQYDEQIGSVMKRGGVRIRREWLTEDSSEVERRLSHWAGESSVPFLSLTKTFRAASTVRPGKLNYVLDGHWTPEGHQVAADAIGKWLTDLGYLIRIG